MSPPLDAPETNFGSMAQAVDSTRADHIADGNKMVKPVAYVTGYRNGFCVINPVEDVVFPTGMALYRSPPTSQEPRQVEPVASIHETGFLVRTPGATLTAGMKLYAAPPKRAPLTDEEIRKIADCGNYVAMTFADGAKGIALDKVTFCDFARAIERAHGIGGEE